MSSFTCLNDQETKVDLLNNEAIAKTIVALLREKPDRPVTIGVHGDWGAGKSSVLEMIEDQFRDEPKILCLKFNGWRFQGFEDAKIALLEGIVAGIVEQRSTVTKALTVAKKITKRIKWLSLVKRVAGVVYTVATGDPAILATPEGAAAAIGDDPLLKPAEEARSVAQEMAAFRKDFKELLEAADVEQLVVLIDDLDRCLPKVAIETLEAIRHFVFTANTAFVVAADEAMIEYAVREHFPSLPESTGSQTYARNYLEKLIQVPFRLPALGETETRIYVTLLLLGAALGEDDDGFGKLLTAARTRLQKPWLGGTLESGAIQTALGASLKAAQPMLTLSEQIGPMLASGTKGNPRQIKRFLNTLALRGQMAAARGFGDAVNIAALAKLMLAERFLPWLFDHIAAIAASASDGTCPDIATIEAAATNALDEVPASDEVEEDDDKPAKPKGKRSDGSKESEKKPKVGESGRITELLSSEAVLAWARLQPPLRNVDLRPYLFVAKDRKDYFGATSSLGPLAMLVEQLMGSKMSVAGLDLKTLAQPEASKVFEALRGRILVVGNFERPPAGIDGLAAVVKSHASLQADLMLFLESLPSDKLGGWVVGGWGNAFIDAALADRWSRLLQKWASSVKNPILKAAAEGVLRVPTARK